MPAAVHCLIEGRPRPLGVIAGLPRLFAVLLLLAWPIFGLPRLAAGQQAAIHYVYDDLNRLIAVVDQQGNVGVYVYDSVGNILRIERSDSAAIPGAVGITLVSPNKGRVGTTVQIFGKGFSATPTENSVFFNGTAATVTAAAANRLVTSVPAGATTGPITLTAPQGSATSPTPFTVVGSIAIDPTTATLAANGTQQFTATGEAGATGPAVRWSVNDITGGDPTIGTISTEGLYTAPAPATVPPGGLTVTVTATHTDDPTVSASASVTIRPPEPAFLAARGVSVQFAERAVNQNLTTTVSVQVADQIAFSGASQVSVALEPVIAAVSPPSGARGAVEFPISITGSGLSGATSLRFLLNNAPDASITVTNLAVTADGAQATAQISISSSAVLGPRVVQIIVPAGTSTAVGTGANVFTVQ